MSFWHFSDFAFDIYCHFCVPKKKEIDEMAINDSQKEYQKRSDNLRIRDIFVNMQGKTKKRINQIRESPPKFCMTEWKWTIIMWKEKDKGF